MEYLVSEGALTDSKLAATPKLRRGSAFARMSRDELIEYCRSIYVRGGIEALSYTSLKKQKSLYPNLYRVGLPQRQLIHELGLEDEYKEHNKSVPLIRAGGKVTYRWTWERCVQQAKNVMNDFGFLPPAGWFQDNGRGGLPQAVYSLGKTWDLLRDAVGDDFSKSSFVESRNGLRWRSHPEASLSNFLYARGVNHKRGEKYPDDYADHSNANYAYYDVHFLSLAGEWINVEIWGDKPLGHAEERYGEKRKDKEAYHAGRQDFVGIHFRDCYSDEALEKILKPYIGIIEPFRFDKPTDRQIQSSHWSNADELLESCRELAKSMPDGKFPTEGWLRKRGKWANRPGDPMNTMSVYIKLWLGGVRKVRELLGQTHLSTETWDKESAIAAYKSFYDKHGMTPEQYRNLFRKGDSSTSHAINKRASNVGMAVLKYAGGSATVKKLLGIPAHAIRRARRAE